MRNQGVELPRLPPAPAQSRWNTWLEAVQYHSEYVVHYRRFFTEEGFDAQGVQRLIHILHPDNFDIVMLYICIYLRCITQTDPYPESNGRYPLPISHY